MFKLFRIVSLIILVTTISTGKLAGQIFWKMNGETGYFKSDANNFSKVTNDLLTRLETEVGYKYLQTSRSAAISLKLRPILYGISHSLKSIKGKLTGTYYHEFDRMSLIIDGSTQKQVYNYNEFSADYVYTTLRGSLSYLIKDDIDLITEIGYSTYDIDAEVTRRSLDFLFINSSFSWFINTNSTIGSGLYIEKYINKASLPFSYGNSNKNSGFRYGPQISVKYLKNFVISTEYRFLIHNSEVTSYPSYEHLLQLMAGKSFLSEFTAFILIDYYSRKYKIKDPASFNLLYTPMNLENHFYFKLGYDVRENIELYIKSGYSKESLFINDLSLAGWNFLVGIGIKSPDPGE
jgi:hypothetical protein